MMRTLVLSVLFGALLGACGRSASVLESAAESATPARIDTSGACIGNCDASALATPVLGDSGGAGSVTTYGGVGNAVPSAGGACNYGTTGITHYAAIQVSVLPGDLKGEWQAGKVCGQCAQVRARTPNGWKSTTVRIVDKCPDAHCGIDLGGAPATELMGAQAGRYSGEWRFVSCEGATGVSDGVPTLHVKEGSNPWWSLVQVRNPESAIVAMRLRPASSAVWDTLPWATEAENFFKVPTAVLSDSLSEYDIEARTRFGRTHAFRALARFLSHPDTEVEFGEMR